MKQYTRETKRLWLRSAFFVLFVLAPPLDLFRFDLTLGHFFLFGYPWTLGIDRFAAGEIGAGGAAVQMALRGLLPIVLVVGGVIWVSWKYGRLYCGWLCPHFSVVETINALMRRAIGKLSVWDKRRLPEILPDGRRIRPSRIWWIPTLFAVVGFAFLWATALLTYLLPPAEVYGNLANLQPTRNQALFIGIGTLLFSIEFLYARHLFCRFGCAVGLFQSLAWMGNKKAMVVGFDRHRVKACTDCDNACDNACPMRLKPRSIKRRMFTCTQCARCLQACDQVMGGPRESLLHWVSGADALDVSDREFGRSDGRREGNRTPGTQSSRCGSNSDGGHLLCGLCDSANSS
ncbi:4Fe-4S binding protein [Thiohalomonas denitrificans]|uniref:4Fe-4S binding domain-containing protein n=1 Tax=Thiohalomonas denitrificans TaxID=415747 RepID=A0A1G5Q905_9GAMM|nr:4Fe-4S binding protein [Thiohalomonas denitrificans]SCZ58157.1 4Fe-4S binding domain-containing protein [Thiohalomonas denitrificans]